MRDAPKRVLVVVDADPRRSSRAVEALRMSVGIAAAENRVRVLLIGEAGRLAGTECAGLPGGGRAAGFLDALSQLGAEVIEGGEPGPHADEAEVVLRWTE